MTPDMLDGNGSSELLNFIRDIQNGEVSNVQFASFDDVLSKADISSLVKVTNLPEFCPTLGAHVEQSYLLPFDENDIVVL